MKMMGLQQERPEKQEQQEHVVSVESVEGGVSPTSDSGGGASYLIFTDGSGLNSKSRALRRCGWALLSNI